MPKSYIKKYDPSIWHDYKKDKPTKSGWYRIVLSFNQDKTIFCYYHLTLNMFCTKLNKVGLPLNRFDQVLLWSKISFESNFSSRGEGVLRGEGAI